VAIGTVKLQLVTSGYWTVTAAADESFRNFLVAVLVALGLSLSGELGQCVASRICGISLKWRVLSS
jgi:hypothetical protein